MQVTKETRRAHVILATSEYSFITWLTDSGYLDFMWLPLTCVRVLMPCGAIAELGVDFFEVQVVGDFPEAEARLFLEKTLGASISDADWAEIFGVRVHACVKGPVPALLPIRFLSGMEGAAIPAPLMCRCVEAMQGVFALLLSTLGRSRVGLAVGDICCVIMA